MAAARGEPPDKVLLAFHEDLFTAHVIVAHNLAFDRAVVQHALKIHLPNMDPWPHTAHEVCTMRSNIARVQAPFSNGNPGWKWPRLQELAAHLRVAAVPESLHDAGFDTSVLVQCFWALAALKEDGSSNAAQIAVRAACTQRDVSPPDEPPDELSTAPWV